MRVGTSPTKSYRYNSAHRAALSLQIVTHPTATWQFLNRHYDAQSIRHRIDKGEGTDSTAG
jgi:hypothetical protein